MSESRGAADLMSDSTEVQRTDHTGRVWFAASLIAVALPVTGMLVSGWRPAELPAVAGTLWWIGAVLLTVGLAGIGYAGCPIYWGDVAVAHRQKSIAIRAGLALLLIGGFVTVAVMLTH